MKVSRLLLLAAVGVGAALFLTRTERGNRLRRDIADRAGDLTRRIRRWREDSADFAEDLLEDSTTVARKARRKQADGQLV